MYKQWCQGETSLRRYGRLSSEYGERGSHVGMWREYLKDLGWIRGREVAWGILMLENCGRRCTFNLIEMKSHCCVPRRESYNGI